MRRNLICLALLTFTLPAVRAEAPERVLASIQLSEEGVGELAGTYYRVTDEHGNKKKLGESLVLTISRLD